MRHYRDVCVVGIDLLHDLARGGSDRARDHLQSIAEVISRVVGDLSRADLDDATRSQRGPTTARGASSALDETARPAARRKPGR